MTRKIFISTKYTKPVLQIHRSAVRKKKLVYICVSNRREPYERGRSAIVYIGTTRKGLSRIAVSAAARAKALLRNYGSYELKVYLVYIKGGRQGVSNSWEKLERALIHTFRTMYGAVPLLNTSGKKVNWARYAGYFAEGRLRKILLKHAMG